MAEKNPQRPAPTVILRRQMVQARTGLSRSTIYLRVSQGTFPRPIPLGSRAVGWLEDEVEAWLQAQVASARTLG
ncbi:helix-turn-helix transcriptional regulator [Luteimonas mephitis]|uniref:helix-turn-helix transcriptional regulator n=1 Tax=Luteimonas mephitis TaxID=83615 RepID=UPI003A9398DE